LGPNGCLVGASGSVLYGQGHAADQAGIGEFMSDFFSGIQAIAL
jgi:hypothetical protein